MSQLIFKNQFHKALKDLEKKFGLLQDEKTILLLTQLPIEFSADELALFVSWQKIFVPVKDRGLCIQLNRLGKDTKLQFVIDKDLDVICGWPRSHKADKI